MESKKYNKLVDITKKKWTHNYRERTNAYQLGVREQKRGRRVEIQTIGLRIYCTTQEI